MIKRWMEVLVNVFSRESWKEFKEKSKINETKWGDEQPLLTKSEAV